jgi:cytochrome c oxidase assembly factor CtaG
VTVEHPQIHWFADPAVLAPLLLIAGIYVWRFREARREAGGRGAEAWRAIAFAGAMLALLGALVTPVDGLGEDYLFSAHMLQHVLLGDIAPLLLLLSLSRVILRPVTRRLMRVERALGLFLAWSSTAHYPFYEEAPRIWGLSAVEDQNVAGVIMMVEQSLTLVLVMVWVFVQMLTRSEQEELRRERLDEAQVPPPNVDVFSTGS